MTSFTPREIVSELDRFIIGQKDAKRAVAIALRNRWRRLQLDNDDAIRWFWYSTLGKFPEPPRIPHDPAAQERARQARAAIEARKQHSVTASKVADGNVILTLDDGTTAKLPARA